MKKPIINNQTFYWLSRTPSGHSLLWSFSPQVSAALLKDPEAMLLSVNPQAPDGNAFYWLAGSDIGRVLLLGIAQSSPEQFANMIMKNPEKFFLAFDQQDPDGNAFYWLAGRGSELLWYIATFAPEQFANMIMKNPEKFLLVCNRQDPEANAFYWLSTTEKGQEILLTLAKKNQNN